MPTSAHQHFLSIEFRPVRRSTVGEREQDHPMQCRGRKRRRFNKCCHGKFSIQSSALYSIFPSICVPVYLLYIWTFDKCCSCIVCFVRFTESGSGSLSSSQRRSMVQRRTVKRTQPRKRRRRRHAHARGFRCFRAATARWSPHRTSGGTDEWSRMHPWRHRPRPS